MIVQHWSFGIVGVLLGLLLGSSLSFFPLTVISVLILLAWAVSGYEKKALVSRRHGLVLYACVLFGVGYWAFSESGNVATDLVTPTGHRVVTLAGVVTAPVTHSPGKMTIIVAVQHVEGASRSGRLRLSWRKPDRDVFRGDTITVHARLRPPYGTWNFGGFDYGAYLRDRGIHVVATIDNPRLIQVRAPDAFDIGARVWRQIDQWRHHVRRAAIATLPQPARGLFLGVIVGEQNDIPSDVRDDFMVTGTVHIISISGSHLGLLAFLSFFGVRWMAHRMPAHWLERLSCVLTPKQLAVLVTVPLVVFYTLLSGAHVATVRSLMMIVLYLCAVWVGHARQTLIALGLAALFTALVDPRAIYSLSFQLSYVSVLCIALAIWRWGGWDTDDADDVDVFPSPMTKLTRWGKSYLLMTLAVTLGTVPLVAYYFNQIAWLGIFANSIVVPLVGFLVVPLGLLSSLVVLLGGVEQLPLSDVQQGIMSVLMSFIDMAASIPGARWHVASPAIPAMAGFYLALCVVLFSWSYVMRLMGVGVLMVCLCWWAWSPRHIFEDDMLRVTFLDVGQGDATVIELPGGQTILVDGGAAYKRLDMGAMVVGPYLWDQGIRRVDHVIATHPQVDHVGGLPWVIGNFDVGRYWSNGSRRVLPFYQRLEQAVREKGLVERIVAEDDVMIDDGTCRLQFLNPPFAENDAMSHASDYPGGSALNNLSVVLSVTCRQHSILLMADAEIDTLARLTGHPLVQSATVVKMPHHGAKSSLHRQWIDQLNATTSVVSAGRGNRYGHPNPDVLEAYRHNDINIYRTDADGAILFSAQPDSKEFRMQRAVDRRPVHLTLRTYSLKGEWENIVRLWARWV